MINICFLRTLGLGFLLLAFAGGCSSQPTPAATVSAPTASQAAVVVSTTLPATPMLTTTAVAMAPAADTPTPPTLPAQQAVFLGTDGALHAATTTNRDIASVAALPADAQPLRLSPNGAALAFVHDGEVFVRVLGTQTDTQIVSATLQADDLTFSPDGRAVIYSIDTSDDAINNPQPQLFLSQLDSKPAQAIGAGLGPIWSPRGDQIAFLGAPFAGSPAFGGGPGGRVMIAARDGSNAHAVGEAEEVHPGWQPLIWSSDGTRLGAGTAIIDTVSGAVVARGIVNKNAVVAGVQALAPDAHAFAFWRNLRAGDPQSDAGMSAHDDLQLVSDTGQARTIAQTAPKGCPCLPVAGQLRPVWTPDGNQFALVDERLGVRLYLGNGLPIGGVRLPSGTGSYSAFDQGAPFWSEDGRTLLMTLFANGQPEAWMLHTEQGGMWRRLGTGVALGWRN